MSSLAYQLYRLLPARLRSFAATGRGYSLRTWRYGPDTEQLVYEAMSRESWPSSRWQEWQDEKLQRILRHAAINVPFYQSHWDDQGHDVPRPERLDQWPLLDRKSIARNPSSFLAQKVIRHRLLASHTSGTSGTPLTLWHSRETLRAWYALAEARWRRWYGVSRSDRWAILGGQKVVPVHQDRPPFWVWNAALRQLYMSSYHLSPRMLSHYLAVLKHYKIVYLLGYTSALYSLAQHVLHSGRTDLRMKVVLTNAEPLYDYQRRAIGRAFQCPVRETYGMTEKVAAASECEHGRLHLWPEVSVLEVLNGTQPALAGEAGELVATSLLCQEMPLIRYRCGDRIALSHENNDSCECGRTLPVIERIEGRCDDLLYTSDGRHIGRLDPVFKGNMPIDEAQIIQESLDRVRVLYVPQVGFTSAHGSQIVAELRARMGPIDVTLQEVRAVPRTENGKFRAVVCLLDRTADARSCPKEA